MHRRRIVKRNKKDNFSCQQQQQQKLKITNQNKILINLQSTKEKTKKYLIEEQWLMLMEDLECDLDFES